MSQEHGVKFKIGDVQYRIWVRDAIGVQLLGARPATESAVTFEIGHDASGQLFCRSGHSSITKLSTLLRKQADVELPEPPIDVDVEEVSIGT